MIIGRSEVSLAANATRQVQQVRTERTVIQRRQPGAAAPAAGTGPPGGAPAGGAPEGADRSGGALGRRQLLPGKLEIMIALVEHLTGRQVRVVDPVDVLDGGAGAGREPARPPGGLPRQGAARTTAGGLPAGWSMDAESVVVRAEHAETGFTAAGRVVDTAGHELVFSVDLRLSRDSLQVTRVRTRVAGEASVDPLVIAYGGGPVALSATSVDLDLTGDGTAERVAFVAAGNGFLVLDGNGNGAVDGGGELFGPATGDGYAELAAYDDDGNGWIDEADAVYADLRLWDEVGGRLLTLAERGVAAIGLASAATPWELTAGGRQAGTLRSSGVWLGEDGAAGLTGHVDLTVRSPGLDVAV